MLSGESAEHLRRVLRARAGDVHEVASGGRVYLARIARVDPQSVIFEVIELLRVEPPRCAIHIASSIFNFSRFEWMLEKITELGASSVQPVISSRTDVHFAKAAAKRVERWRKIAHEAAQQSRRADVPEVGDPCALSEFIERTRDSGYRLIFSEGASAMPCVQVLDGIAELPPAMTLLYGPEGGWTPEEIRHCTQSGWRAVSLGSEILRAETAAITGLGWVRYRVQQRGPVSGARNEAAITQGEV